MSENKIEKSGVVLFCLLLIREVADLISGIRRNQTYVNKPARKLLLCMSVTLVRDQLLEPPAGALMALVEPKKSLGSRSWHTN